MSRTEIKPSHAVYVGRDDGQTIYVRFPNKISNDAIWELGSLASKLYKKYKDGEQ